MLEDAVRRMTDNFVQMKRRADTVELTRRSITPTGSRAEDSYSLAAYTPSRTSPDLEQRIWAAMREAPPGLPIVEIVTQVPQIFDADLDDFYSARNHALARATGPQASAGRPKRNVHLVGEVAYMVDVERRPRRMRHLGGGGNFDVLAYSARHVTARSSHVNLDGVQRNLRRWVQDGRKVLHDIGAFPWAVVPAGALPRNWWLEADFQDALRKWQAGYFPRHDHVRTTWHRPPL